MKLRVGTKNWPRVALLLEFQMSATSEMRLVPVTWRNP